MIDKPGPDDRDGRRRLGTVGALALIGGVVVGTAAVFAGVAGWLSPHRLTPERLMAAFDATGAKSGFRRNHAKGLCATGTFDSNGDAVSLSRAAVFRPGRSPVVARFALAGAPPFQPDAPKKVKSLGLRFQPAGAEEWRTAMIDLPVFPVRNVQEFYETLQASVPGPDGKPDPERMKAFVATHPETAAALAIVKTRAISSGFADDTYNSLNAFVMTSADGTATPVRWSFVPLQPFAAPSPDVATSNPNYLFDDMTKALAAQPLRWHLMITVGQPGDPTADATKPWPADRRTVDAGTLTLDTVHSEDDHGVCTNVNYDPLILPDGIAGSDDPLLAARSSAYARSFTLRTGEVKPSSAVTETAVNSIETGGKP